MIRTRPVACGGPGGPPPPRFAWPPLLFFAAGFRPRLPPPPHGSGGPLLQNFHATGLIRTVLIFIFRQFGPLCMMYSLTDHCLKNGPDKMRCGADLRWVPTKCGAVRICGADLNIVTKCCACLNQRYCILEYYAKHCGSTADPLRPVDSCGPIVL